MDSPLLEKKYGVETVAINIKEWEAMREAY